MCLQDCGHCQDLGQSFPHHSQSQVALPPPPPPPLPPPPIEHEYMIVNMSSTHVEHASSPLVICRQMPIHVPQQTQPHTSTWVHANTLHMRLVTGHRYLHNTYTSKIISD